MKLVHSELEKQIIFSENKINVLTVEHKKLFIQLIEEFLRQINGDEGSFILSENNKELEISKFCEMIIEPFNLDFNNKKIVNTIYSQLKNLTIDEFHYLETLNIKRDILKYIDTIIFDYDIPLEVDNDFDITALFKALNIKVENENSSLLEKLINYISLLTDLTNIRLFILINIKQFFSYEELKSFYSFVNYTKVSVLLLETVFIEPKHESEQHYIIDADLCEIY